MNLQMKDSQIKLLLVKSNISCYTWKNDSCLVQNCQELENNFNSALEEWGKWREEVASSWPDFDQLSLDQRGFGSILQDWEMESYVSLTRGLNLIPEQVKGLGLWAGLGT